MFSFQTFVRVNTVLAGAYRLAYLNLLWVVTTVLGLGLFGVGPASYALAAYVDGWFRLGLEPPVARTFFAAALGRFWPSVLTSWIYLAAGAVVVVNIVGTESWAVRVLNLGALAVLAVSLSYVYSVMAALDLPTIRGRVAASLMIGFGSLHLTVLGALVVGLVVSVLYGYALPLLALFGVGIPAAAVGAVTRYVYRDLAQVPDQALATEPGAVAAGTTRAAASHEPHAGLPAASR
ncbi:YesL family protein [Antribacter gilvus]|uniref:YesL family protein n=1 Tax=Antribacter gilvus TaxID=2304675 RepID=UPI000F7A0F4F|nr:DUF624 domain-containing protein [Antribacter gilvus]